ncbi:MAG: hypothetical protein OEQ39_01755 [Gammaproteobacteria bacterium]|nr:hypothetical protein [Gammaproteobacteria bacterium]MDH3464572.1 hypothetical protein [Gammaproteobacteria bacterium]
MQARSLSNWILIVAFGASIWLPLAAQRLQGSSTVGPPENRTMAPFPSLRLNNLSIRNFPNAFDRYYDDNFGLRNDLLRIANTVNYDHFGGSGKVIRGDGEWLFLVRGTQPGARKIALTRDLCGRARFSAAELEQWASALIDNFRQLRARNIEYLFVLAPNKHTIYKRHLPIGRECANRPSRIDQLLKAVRQEPDFPVLDLRSALAAAAHQPEPLWHKTDTHWNGNGIAVAYRQILHTLDRNDRNAFDNGYARLGHERTPPGDLAGLLGLQDRLSEDRWVIRLHQPNAIHIGNPYPHHTPIATRQPEAYRRENIADDTSHALIFRDSFIGNAFEALLAESFVRTVFVWQGAPGLPFDLIDDEKPQLIVHEMVERNLLNSYSAEAPR